MMQISALSAPRLQNTDGSCKDSATEGGHGPMGGGHGPTGDTVRGGHSPVGGGHGPAGGRHSADCCLTNCDAKIMKIFMRIEFTHTILRKK